MCNNDKGIEEIRMGELYVYEYIKKVQEQVKYLSVRREINSAIRFADNITKLTLISM